MYHSEKPCPPTPKKAELKKTISSGLLMVPKKAGLPMAMTITKHKRAGSTGTTGDESCSTDEDIDEPDFATTTPSFNNDYHGFYSGISTITDKVSPSRTVIKRNSSDSSVYSDRNFDESSSNDSDCKSVAGSELGALQKELKEAHLEIKLKDEEVGRLSRIRNDVETELEDLTASLFEEAHNMVREANEKQAAAEKALTESQMKVDVLTAEVAALKTLVLTSTPSRPNPHLHPQIDRTNSEGVAIFTKKHRRSPSHFNLKYGRENSPPQSPVKETVQNAYETDMKEGLEVDPLLNKEFLSWKETPTINKDDPFIKRIFEEDINLCLMFTNSDLSQKVTRAVESGSILIEAVDKTKAMFPKKCALLEIPRLCFYRMNIGEPDTWYSISQICRNRVIAVCDFLNYLKYIERGLVKSSPHDMYWETIRLRKNMVLARLGLNLSN